MEDARSPSEQYGNVMDTYEAAAAPSRDATRNLLHALHTFDEEHTALLKLLTHGDQIWDLRQTSVPGSPPHRTASENMKVALREMEGALDNQEAALHALYKKIPKASKAIEALRRAVDEVASFQSGLRKNLKERIRNMENNIAARSQETEEAPRFKAEKPKQRSASPRRR